MNHTIRIEKIIHGGQGLGRLEDGIIVMTRFVLPGEEVEVKEKKKQRGYIEAEPVKILQPAADRVDPPCPYYMQCGGCDFQHIEDDLQPRLKTLALRETLERVGGIAWPEQSELIRLADMAMYEQKHGDEGELHHAEGAV